MKRRRRRSLALEPAALVAHGETKRSAAWKGDWVSMSGSCRRESRSERRV
jgi:hypothetical protein